MKYIKQFELYSSVHMRDKVVITDIKGLNFKVPVEKYDEYNDILCNSVGDITEINITTPSRVNSVDIKYKNLPEYFTYFANYIHRNGDFTFRVDYDYVRLATEEEIENQKIKDSASTYNL